MSIMIYRQDIAGLYEKKQASIRFNERIKHYEQYRIENT